MEFKGSKASKVVVSTDFHGAELSIESGWVAKQANGAVIVRQGETMVLVTACLADARPDQDFFPLVVDYQEKMFSAGKIPGGYFKREARPAEHEILTCRLIDRPIRPLFPEGYCDEVQIIATVLSADGVHSPDVLAICGTSAALHISEAPFLGPIAGVRIGRVAGKLVINPSSEQLKDSDLDFIVAASKESIVMVEGGAKFVPEKEVLEALNYGHQEIKKLIALQDDLRAKVGKEKVEFVAPVQDAELVKRTRAVIGDGYKTALGIANKKARGEALKEVSTKVKEVLATEFPEREKEVSKAANDLKTEVFRSMIVDQKKRVDGRALDVVRPIECETGILPRAHGSALFTRGETQAIVTATLGTNLDSQRIDTIYGDVEKRFLLHYNFPPYSVGEVRMQRGTGRREVGHGALAERALKNVLPEDKDFPYVVRIVSDITESNGSSSMASVCGGSMAMMAAGIKIKEAVGGVAMGLIKEGDKVAVLTDILGDEDHYGDMDFKVCGTKSGITALQMDIKCTGLSSATMEEALEQARKARVHIIGEMEKAISKTSDELSRYAPVITTLKVNPDKIRDIIGPGGKMIRSITERTGAKIDIDDDGTVRVASADGDSASRAIQIIKDLTEEAEVGKVYEGTVKRIMDFGAFVEIFPGTEGLVHISQLDVDRVEHVTDICQEGDKFPVKVLEIDRQGRIRLSRRALLEGGDDQSSDNR